MDTAQKEERLQEILATMDIPEMRLSDMRWLSRNIFIRNADNPDIDEAIALIKELM